MKQNLKLEFIQDGTPREDFLERVKTALFNFIPGESWRGSAFIMLVTEIVKNIYDHANSTGYAHFEKDNTGITFEIRDFGANPSSLKKESDVNFGIGLLTIIPGIAEGLGINLKTDTSQGFIYQGTWKYDE